MMPLVAACRRDWSSGRLPATTTKCGRNEAQPVGADRRRKGAAHAVGAVDRRQRESWALEAEARRALRPRRALRSCRPLRPDRALGAFRSPRAVTAVVPRWPLHSLQPLQACRARQPGRATRSRWPAPTSRPSGPRLGVAASPLALAGTACTLDSRFRPAASPNAVARNTAKQNTEMLIPSGSARFTARRT